MFRVLIVDDELYIREGLKALIKWEKLGFMICGQAENGENALKVIEEVKPDVIITDIKMPLMNGLELIEKLYEELKLDVKFIVLSGYNEFDYAKKAMKYGVKDYILKPIEEEELETVFKELYMELVKERKDKEDSLRIFNSLSEISLKTILKSVADKESVENTKKFLNVSYNEYFRYVMLELETTNTEGSHENEADEINNLYLLRNYLVEILGDDYKYNILKEDSHKKGSVMYGIVITKRLLKNYNDDLSFLIGSIYEQLGNKINNNIYIYVGKEVSELLLLRESYDSALFAHSISYCKKNCNVIYYDELEDELVSSEFNDEINFDDLVEAIENNKNDEIDIIINSRFNEEDARPIDLKMLHIKINYLVYQIIKIVSKMNGKTAEIIKCSSNFNYINLVNFHEIKNSMKMFSHYCAKLINNLRQNQAHGVLFDIEKYIQENYNKRITIKEVANQFYINSAYLGQIFKKKYGVSFSDYLHQYRIEKSKELLKHTDFKIYEISEKLGYKCSDNFIEKFEKINGMTPLQYRRNI